MISTTKELLLSAEKTNSAIAAFTCYNALNVTSCNYGGEKANKGVL